jgi:glycosyltransferase involved in cell wall biosynthesis
MPYSIVDIEVTQPLPNLVVPEGNTGFALVVREKGRVIGFLMKEQPGKCVLNSEELSLLIKDKVKFQPYKQNQSEKSVCPCISESFFSLTVAICTKDNPQELNTCLTHILNLISSELKAAFEIIVIDNASFDDLTEKLVASLPGVRYVREPKPGLNFARNRALQEATGEIIAFIDDDVIIDKYWLKGLEWAIAEHPDAAAYTGLVLPAELETDAQILFEKRGGFEKSFETIRYGRTLPGHPFYPCIGGKFGTGCNMAFRRLVLLELGGFDEALDSGETLPGGGDTDMFYRVVRAGYPLIYEPRILVFHRHRREYAQLRRQYSRSWGQGLMAYVAKTYKNDDAQRPNLRRLVIWWFISHLYELLQSLKGGYVLTPDLVLAELWGGIAGILGAYPRSLRRVERIRKQYSASEDTRGDSAT